MIQLEKNDGSDFQNSPNLSPLPLPSPKPPVASSIHSIRRASHTATLEKRASFGASREVVESMAQSPQPPRAKPSNLTPQPWITEESNRLSIPGKRSDISRSHHTFVTGAANALLTPTRPLEAGQRSLSTHSNHGGHSDIARSAILSGIGQAVDDDEKLGTAFGSHDMVSINSRWTDQDESYSGTGSGGDDSEPGAKDVQAWHELHRPPKMIRSMRFSFNTATSSTMEPDDIYKQFVKVLQMLTKRYQNYFVFQRQNPDYYLLTCRLMHPSREVDSSSLFEIEVCKVWLLKLHGIRIKRIAGNPLLFKEVYSFIESELKLT